MKRRVLSIILVLTMLFSSVPEVDTVFSYALDLSEEIESLDTHDCCEEHVHDHDCCEECLHDYGCCEDCDCSDTCEHNHDCCDECDCCEGCCGESESSADSVEVNEIVNMFNASAPSQALSLGALNAPALLGSSLFASVNDADFDAVFVSGVQLTPSAPYWSNESKNASNSNLSYNAYYDFDSHTLYLNEARIDSCIQEKSVDLFDMGMLNSIGNFGIYLHSANGASTTICADGKNVVSILDGGDFSAAIFSENALTIYGADADASLLLKNRATSYSIGVMVNYDLYSIATDTNNYQAISEFATTNNLTDPVLAATGYAFASLLNDPNSTLDIHSIKLTIETNAYDCNNDTYGKSIGIFSLGNLYISNEADVLVSSGNGLMSGAIMALSGITVSDSKVRAIAPRSQLMSNGMAAGSLLTVDHSVIIADAGYAELTDGGVDDFGLAAGIAGGMLPLMLSAFLHVGDSIIDLCSSYMQIYPDRFGVSVLNGAEVTSVAGKATLSIGVATYVPQLMSPSGTLTVQGTDTKLTASGDYLGFCANMLVYGGWDDGNRIDGGLIISQSQQKPNNFNMFINDATIFEQAASNIAEEYQIQPRKAALFLLNQVQSAGFITMVSELDPTVEETFGEIGGYSIVSPVIDSDPMYHYGSLDYLILSDSVPFAVSEDTITIDLANTIVLGDIQLEPVNGKKLLFNISGYNVVLGGTLLPNESAIYGSGNDTLVCIGNEYGISSTQSLTLESINAYLFGENIALGAGSLGENNSSNSADVVINDSEIIALTLGGNDYSQMLDFGIAASSSVKADSSRIIALGEYADIYFAQDGGDSSVFELTNGSTANLLSIAEDDANLLQTCQKVDSWPDSLAGSTELTSSDGLSYSEENAKHNVEHIEAKQPTEDEAGYTAYDKCYYCGAEIGKENISAGIRIGDVLLTSERPYWVNGADNSVSAVQNGVYNAYFVSTDTKDVLYLNDAAIRSNDGTYARIEPRFATKQIEIVLTGDSTVFGGIGSAS